MQPIVLGPNLPDTFYRGAGRIARLRGGGPANHTTWPEDWVASATPGETARCRATAPTPCAPRPGFAAKHLANPYGKTEAWIILDAEPDAEVHLSFTREVGAGQLAEWVEQQDVESILEATNRIPGIGR